MQSAPSAGPPAASAMTEAAAHAAAEERVANGTAAQAACARRWSAAIGLSTGSPSAACIARFGVIEIVG
jgi:hypothetical protein